jgi:hypothetical protein
MLHLEKAQTNGAIIMAILDKWQRTGQKIDGFVGRIVYRFFGLVAGLIGFAAAWAAWDLLANGKSIIGGLLFAACAAGSLWLAKWCFSPSRKLSEMDF